MNLLGSLVFSLEMVFRNIPQLLHLLEGDLSLVPRLHELASKMKLQLIVPEDTFEKENTLFEVFYLHRQLRENSFQNDSRRNIMSLLLH